MDKCRVCSAELTQSDQDSNTCFRCRKWQRVLKDIAVNTHGFTQAEEKLYQKFLKRMLNEPESTWRSLVNLQPDMSYHA